jgi:hypothetical protein
MNSSVALFPTISDRNYSLLLKKFTDTEFSLEILINNGRMKRKVTDLTTAQNLIKMSKMKMENGQDNREIVSARDKS